MTTRDLSLVDVLSRRAQSQGATELYRFCRSPEAPPETLSYSGLDQRSRRIAQQIRRKVPPRGRVLILCDFGPAFPIAFFACLYAGVTAIPAYPPDGSRSLSAIERVRHIVSDAQPHLVVTDGPLDAEVLERVPALAALPALTIGDVRNDAYHADDWGRPPGLEDELAFLQYSSGSTRAPRGVEITHANLQAHQERAHEVFQSPEGATTVSWLPFYHDMGLIGSMLYPLFCGGRGVFLPPASFLRRPLWWLKCVSDFGARTSTAPNFAYDLCTRRAKDAEVAALDLSAWEITVCGAEPVRADTMARFIARFGPAGFRPQTFLPCFGLAEATLVGTAPAIAALPRIRHFDSSALRRGEVVEVEATHPHAEEQVSCGRPTRDHELAVVNPHSLERVEAGSVGEIWLRGPSVSQGYFGRAAESRELLNAIIKGELAGTRHWARTGDRGAIYEGELYVLGRQADLMRVQDQDWRPEQLEAVINEHRPRGVVGEAVVFQLETGGPTILACEARKLDDPATADRVCEQLAAELHQRAGFRIDQVLLLPPRTVAKTSSGKLRRFRYREAFVERELALRHHWHAPRGAPSEARVTSKQITDPALAQGL